MMPGIIDGEKGEFFCGYLSNRDAALAETLVEKNPLLPRTPETVHRVSASLDATVEEVKRSLTAAPPKKSFTSKSKPAPK